MKYLPFFLLFLASCATTKSQPPTSEFCMKELDKKIDMKDKSQVSKDDLAAYQIGLYVVCDLSQNDPELAYKEVRQLSDERRKNEEVK